MRIKTVIKLISFSKHTTFLANIHFKDEIKGIQFTDTLRNRNISSRTGRLIKNRDLIAETDRKERLGIGKLSKNTARLSTAPALN